MPGAVTVGGLIINMSADVASLRTDMNAATTAVQSSARTMIDSMTGVSASSDRASDAGQRLIDKLKQEIAQFGMTNDQLIQHKANLAGVGAEAGNLIARLNSMRDAERAFAQAANDASMSTRSHGAEVRAASGHMEGFSLASTGARRELLVLVHELSQGNFKRFGGSLMVLGEQTGAASLLFSGAGIAALALVGALGTLAYAMVKGAEEQREMANALIMTGNYAGATSDSLNALAHVAAGAAGSISDAKKAVTELAATGKYTSAQIGYISEAAIAMEHATGESVEKTIAAFDTLTVQGFGNATRATEQVSKAALKLDDQYHYLTESIYEQIRALEKEGDAKAASELATRTFADVTKERAEESVKNIGYIAAAWKDVKHMIGGAIDAAGEWGKKATQQDAIDKYKGILEHMDAQPGWISGNGQGGAAQAQFEESRLRIVKALTAAVIEKNTADAAAIKQGNDMLAQSEAEHAAQRIMSDDTRLAKKGMSELQVAIQEYGEDLAKVAASNPGSKLLDQAAVNAHMEELRKLHTEIAKGTDDRMRLLQDELTNQRAALDGEKSVYEARDKMLELYHKKFGTSDDEFYAGRAAARAEYMASEAASYAVESAMVLSFSAKTPAEVAARKKMYDEMTRQHEDFLAKNRAAEGQDRADAEADIEKRYDDYVKAVTKAGDEELKRLDAILAKQLEHNAEIGKTKEQIESLRAAKEQADTEDLQREDDAIRAIMTRADLDDVLNAKEQDIYAKRLAYLDLEIAKRNQIAAAMADGSVAEANAKAAADASKAWETAAKTIESSLADAIANGGANAWKRLKTMLVSQVLQIPISFVGSFGANLLNPGAPQAAIANGIGGQEGQAISLAQTASSLYKAISGGFESLSSSVADGVQVMLNKAGLSDHFLSNGPTAQFAGQAASSFASITAGHYIGNAIAGDYSVAHGQTVTNIAAAIGEYLLPGIGGAIGGAVGGLINRAFGMGSKEVTGTSLVGQFGANGFAGSNNSTWHQNGGWFRSDKNGTDSTPVDAATAGQLGGAYSAIKSATADFAKTLGLNADLITNRTDSLNIAFGKDAAANQKAIADWFAKLGDTMAHDLLPTIDQFSKAATEFGGVGESASATLQRLATDYAGVDAALKVLGKDFGAVGADSIAAREHLIDFAGGLQNLTSQTASFAQNFLTDAEKLAPVQKALDAAMAQLGLSSITTRDQFKQVVLGLDLTTEAGAKEYAAMISLSDAFAQVHAAARSEADILNERKGLQDQLDQITMSSAQLLAKQRDALDDSNKGIFDQIQAEQAKKTAAEATASAIAKAQQTAADAMIAAAEAQRSAMQSLGNSLTDTIAQSKKAAEALTSFNTTLLLGGSSTLDPKAKYALAKKQLATAGPDSLPGAVTAFLDASKGLNSTGSFDYAKDFAATQSALSSSIAYQNGTESRLASFWQQVQKLGLTSIGAHAKGGIADGWSLVGEQGPELVDFTSPARVYTAHQTRAALSGDGGSYAELKAEIATLRTALEQIAVNTSGTTRILKRVAPNDVLQVETRTEAAA